MTKNIIERYQQLNRAVEALTDRRDEVEYVIHERLRALYNVMNAGRSIWDKEPRRCPSEAFTFEEVAGEPNMIEVRGTYRFPDGDGAGAAFIVPRDYLLGEKPNVDAWLAETKAAAERKAARAKRAEAARAERAERDQLAKLKAKYEGQS